MALGSTQPFRPSGTVSLAATTTALNATMPSEGEAVLAFNASGNVAFLRFGTDASVIATASDIPVPPNARMLVHVGQLARTVSVLLSNGAGTVYVTRGDGTVY